MSNPLVSVITPAYDAAVYLTRAVASVMGQTYPQLEHIIVAQDHIDYEAQLRRAGLNDPRIRFVSTAHPGESTAAALNAGLAEARGDVIAPLAATDLFYANRLERLVPLAMNFGAASDNRRIVDERTRTEVGTLMPLDGRMRAVSRLAFLRLMVPLGLVARRHLFESGWNTEVGELYHLLANLRIVAACKQLPVVPQPLHELRLGDGRGRDPFDLLDSRRYWRKWASMAAGGIADLDPVSSRMLAIHMRRRVALSDEFEHTAWHDGARFLTAQGLLVPPGSHAPGSVVRTSHAA